ncbi:unnamed protein product [Sphagnum jensenii]|uniref:Uncharacterized protein n=1 Tax=Sphagnum jensenii TaxID=128206 RepID=A0ABP1ANW1_9BRYO
MKPDVALDYVIFQLTPPARTRCELLVARGKETEKLASGLLKPFLSHLKAAEEQILKGADCIKLQPPPGYAGDQGGASLQKAAWFTKGTIERFVRFVSTPEVLEHVSTVETELTQLEETISMQANESSQVTQNSLDGGDNPITDDSSKRRLLRAMDARKMLLQKEQGLAFARASAAGFDMQHMERLLVFCDCFGATRLRDACVKYMAICKKSKEAGLWIDEMEFAGPEATGPHHMSASSDIRYREADMWSDVQSTVGNLQVDEVGDMVSVRSHRTHHGESTRGFSSLDMHHKQGHSDVPNSAMSPTRYRDVNGEYRSHRSIQAAGDYVAQGQEFAGRAYTEDSSLISNSGSGWPPLQSSHALATRYAADHTSEPGTNLDAARHGVRSHRPRRVWGPPPPHFLAKQDHLGLQSTGGLTAFERNNDGDFVTCTTHTMATNSQIVQDTKQGGYPDGDSSLLPKYSEGLPSWATLQEEHWQPSASYGVGAGHGSPHVQDGGPGTGHAQVVSQTGQSQSNQHSLPPFGQQEQKATGNTGAASSASAVNHVVHSGLLTDHDIQSGVEQEAQKFIEQVPSRRLPRRATSPRRRSPSPIRRVQVAHPSLRRSGVMMKHVNYLNSTPNLERIHAKESESSESLAETDESDSAPEYEDDSLPMQGALHLNSGRTSDQKEHELPSTFQDRSTGGSLPSPDQNTGRESWGWNAPTEYGIQPSGESEDQNSAKEFQSMSPKESKGRFYEQYREKRDAKLREELGSKKAEREAKLKSMQEVLERRKAEMAARSGRLSEKYAVLGTEKGDVLIKSKSQKRQKRITARSSPTPVDSVSAGSTPRSSSKHPLTTPSLLAPLAPAPVSAAPSKSSTLGKQSPPKKGANGTIRSTVASPSPSSAPKMTRTSQRRPQSTKQPNTSENPLSRSVPSLAELRKENKKPSLVRTSTYTDRALPGNNKISNTVIRSSTVPLEANGSRPTVRASTTDDKKRHTNTRKSIGVVSESPKEGPASTPLKVSKTPAIDQKPANKVNKRLSLTGAPASDSKPFLRKGRGIGPGDAAKIRRSKVASVPDVVEKSPDEETPATLLPLPSDKEEDQCVSTSVAMSVADLPICEASEPSELVNSESVAPTMDIQPSNLQPMPCDLSSIPVSLPQVEPFMTPQILILSSPDRDASLQHLTIEVPSAVVSDSFSIDDTAIAIASRSPSGSPASQSYPRIQQSRSPDTVQTNTNCLRKKWATSQVSAPPITMKESPRGLKRLLKFGRKKTSASTATEWPSISSPSEADEDAGVVSSERGVWSEDSHVTHIGVKSSASRIHPLSNTHSWLDAVPFVRSSIPTPPPNFKLREDHLSGGSRLKAPRSFFSLSSFRGKSKQSIDRC